MIKLIFFFLLSTTVTSYCQSTKFIDSLQKELSVVDKTKKQIEILNLLAFELKYNNCKQAKAYAKQGLKLAVEELEYKQISFYYTLGRIYKYENKKDSAKLMFYKSVGLAKKHDRQLLMADSYMSLGIMYKNMSKQDTAMMYYKMAENLVQNKDNQKAHSLVISIKINQANIIEYSDKTQAITILKNAENLCVKFKIRQKLPDIYSNLANIFFDIFDYKQALKYHEKALYFDLQTNNKRMLAYDYSMLSSSFLNLGMLDSCLIYAQESLELAKKNNSIDQLSYSELVLSSAFIETEKFDKAYNHAFKAFKLANNLNNPEVQLYSCINMASARLHYGPIHETKLYLDKAIIFLDQNDIPISRKEAYNIYMRYYYRVNDIKNALRYHRLYSIIQNRLLDEERKSSIQEIELKYATEKKQALILKLNNKNLKNESRLYQSKISIYAISVCSIFGFVLVYLYWNRKRQEQKLKILESSIQASEKEKKRIGKELHDGIASSLIRLVHEVEDENVVLSNKLLSTYKEVRNVSHQLNNTSSFDELFIERLMEIIPEEKENQIFHFITKPTSLIINEPFGTHIYRIIQELIANFLKHAKATNLFISIQLQSNILTVDYSDNGIGIIDLNIGSGLKNIADRVKLMKGNLDFHLPQEKGFQITIKIPYDEHINY